MGRGKRVAPVDYRERYLSDHTRPDRPERIHVIDRPGCQPLVLTARKICELYDAAQARPLPTGALREESL